MLRYALKTDIFPQKYYDMNNSQSFLVIAFYHASLLQYEDK